MLRRKPSRKPSRKLRIEALAQRLVFAQITGTVTLANDQVNDDIPSEIVGATVWLDVNNNLQLDAEEPSATTDSQGKYLIDGVAPGSYALRMEPPIGFFQSSPMQYFSYAWENEVASLIEIDSVTGGTKVIAEDIGYFSYGLIKTKQGEFYGAGHVQDALYHINISQDRIELVGNTGKELVAGLAYDPIGDEIYTLARDSDVGDRWPPLRLYRLDRETAELKAVSDHIPEIDDIRSTTSLALDWVRRQVVLFDNRSKTFFAYTLDGRATQLGTMTVPSSFYNLAFDGERFLAHVSFGTESRLYEVDPYTAELTLVRSLDRALHGSAADIASVGEPIHVNLIEADSVTDLNFEVRYLEVTNAAMSFSAGNSVTLAATDGSFQMTTSVPGKFCIGGSSRVELFEWDSMHAGFEIVLGPEDDRIVTGGIPASGILFGEGVDTLELTSSIRFDLQSASNISGLDNIDLTRSVNSHVILDENSLIAISDRQRLRLTMDANDSWELHGKTVWELSVPPAVDGGARVHQMHTDRALLEIVDGRGWTNPLTPLDVNADGLVSPQDALLVINMLNLDGSPSLSVNELMYRNAVYVDTNGDTFLTPSDALVVINRLNLR